MDKKKRDITQLVYGKLPPQALEIEEAVIGACLLERETFETIIGILPNAEMFYKDEHQKIYRAMSIIFKDGKPVDLLTVCDQLKKTQELDKIGGMYAIAQISQSVLSSAHAQHHALIIAEKFNARELIRICGDAIAKAYSSEEDIFDLLDSHEKNIKSISEGTSQSEFTQIGETFSEILMDFEQLKNKPDGLTGIDTGYSALNELTDGFQPSNLILLAARPSQGKTALALNFAINANCGVLIFSLEAHKKELVKRFAAMKTGVYFSAVKKGQLTAYQENLMIQYINHFNELDIKIDDKTQNLSKIIAGIRREKKKNQNMKLVIVDYVQLIRGEKDRNGNREQEVANISRSLKLIASELEISIIALSQLNREVEKTATRRPTLANLRESGALEQDANIVMMIWHKAESETDIKSYIVVEKNRDGKVGEVELQFNGDIQKWITPNPFDKPDNAFAGFQRNRPTSIDDEPAPF